MSTPAPKAFKDWQTICDALATGRQTILLRKGGIHEGRDGFSFAHDEFFLFPTRYHDQAKHLRESAPTETAPEWQVGEPVTITHFARAEWAITLTDWAKVAALEPHHIYTEETVRQRFDWEGKGMASGSIHVALVRVFALAEPWTFPYEKSFGGCRSWIDPPEPPHGWRETMRPVLDESAFAKLDASLRG